MGLLMTVPDYNSAAVRSPSASSAYNSDPQQICARRAPLASSFSYLQNNSLSGALPQGLLKKNLILKFLLLPSHLGTEI
ncbi:hypothetical protein AAC387_Pa04g0971 [Persea americana]